MAIQQVILENGMQVILEEQHAAKVISFQALCKVGSSCETDAEAGICHVIEHMLFKGTPARPTGTIARDVEAAGGDINAYTSIDQTVYYINMASQFADKGLAILADAIQHPLFDAEELGREAEVILEEIRREHDNPNRHVTEQLFRHAFRVHTYGRPIIGYPETVKGFTRDQLLAFHRKWYTPQNIAFIVVGDFETEAMLERIRRQFADFQGPPPPPLSLTPEPQHKGAKLFFQQMNVQSVYLSLGFNIPEITHEDVPALDILAHVLGGSDSSRLEQEIKEKRRLVHNIYSYAFTPKYPGILSVGAMLEERHLENALTAIRGEITKLMTEPVTSEELSRAKLNIRSNEIYDRETVGGQAGKIASFLSTAGSYEFEARYYQMLSDVRAEKVREVACRYLSPENTTATLIVPQGAKIKGKEKKLISAMSAPAPARKQKKGIPQENVQKHLLKNGMTLLLLEDHSLPIVSLCVAALGGTRAETPCNNGISGLMARMITKGTGCRTAVDIAREIERIAGSIDGFSGRNSCGVKCEFLSEHLHDGFSIFADVLTHPTFSSSEFVKERNLVLKAIRDQEDNLPSFAFAEFLRTLFPKHPYGLRQIGTKESVKKITRDQLTQFHRKTFRSESMVLSISGDINAREAIALADELLADIPRGKSVTREIARDPIAEQSQTRIITKREKQQAHIAMGFQGTSFKSQDRYAIIVLNNILSGQGGRLFRNLRDRMSLAYSVSSMHQEGIEPGYFAVYIGTDPSKVDTAIAAMLHELERIRSERVSDEELARAQQYLVGTYELDLQRNGSRASLHAFNHLYGLGTNSVTRYPNRIMKVTVADVLKVARRYIRPDAYTMAVVRPK